jgi:uncharacterized phosphosugar-binding protein
VADALKGIAMEKLEIINPFTLSPWEERIQTITEDLTATQLADNYDVCIAVSSSARNGVVGIGGAVSLPASVQGGHR